MLVKRVLVMTLAVGLALAPAAVAGLPLISEVFYDAVGSDDGLSFVELYGAPGRALDGFVLEGINGSNGEVTDTLLLSGVIPDDGLFVVADALGASGSLVAEADLVLGFDFQNGPDSVVLRLGPDVIDAVGYGEFGPGTFFAGEGTPAPDAPAGSSLARRFADLDSGDNFADFAVLDVPTPGRAPLANLPEPASGVLLLGGLAGLAHQGRARRPDRSRG